MKLTTNIYLPICFKLRSTKSPIRFTGHPKILKAYYKECYKYKYKWIFDKETIRNKEILFMKSDALYKNTLINELIEECGMDPLNFKNFGVSKQYVVQHNISMLKKLNLLPSNIDITERLLSYLEPFPFDISSEYCKKYKFLQENDLLTIKMVRDMVECQYLAWKFNVPLDFMGKLLSRFQTMAAMGRSIRNTDRNLNIINETKCTENQNIINKVFLLYIRPFGRDTLANFKHNFLGIDWDEIGKHYPKTLQKSYQFLMLILEILKNEGFTDNQIRRGLPFYAGKIIQFLHKLNYMLTEPDIACHRNDENFLLLLGNSLEKLIAEHSCKDRRYLELLDKGKARIKVRYSSTRANKAEIYFYLCKYLNVDSHSLKNIQRHPKFNQISYMDLCNTIKFLKGVFPEQEIVESITLTLYPTQHINLALEKIKTLNLKLKTLGYCNGRVAEETHMFRYGTKSKNKLLQLCLYFLEQPVNFNGTGIFKQSVDVYMKKWHL